MRYALAVSDGEKLEVGTTITHPTEIKRVYEESGVQILLAQNIRCNRLDFSTTVYMPHSIIDQIVRNRLLPDDVVMTRSGANFGDAAVYKGTPPEIYACADCLIMRPKGIPGGYLSTYLNTGIGRALLTRGAYGMAQPHIAPNYLYTMRLPRLGEVFERDIDSLVIRAYEFEEHSKALYAEAEALLLAELGLDDLDLSHQPTYTQAFSQAWATGRLDAEHYQPKYYALLARLQETGQAVRLGDWLTEPVKRGVQPEYDENGTVIVINSQHVGKTHVELEDNRRTTQAFAEQNERAIVHPYDVLLNSTGYITIGRCQTLLDDVAAIVDGHVSIIRPKVGLDPVFLGLFLNSLPGQMQTERSWTGSSGQIELRSELVEDYTMWKPDEALQRRIRELVEEAHVARQKAHCLLEEAKRRVEEMVLGQEG